MTRRLLLSYLTVTIVVLALVEVPLAVFYGQRERERLAADVEHDATVLATYYEDALELGARLEPLQAMRYWADTGARVIVVDVDGTSLVDTNAPVDRDYSTRPEVATALSGTANHGTRHSETLGADLMYVAVPVASAGEVYGAVRITLDTGDVDARVRRVWVTLAAMAAVVLAAAALIGWTVARSVTRPLRRLGDDAARFAAGDLSVAALPHEGPPEIQALGRSLDSMAQRLDELLRTQRAFVADASHQLRTPLTALRLRLENLQAELPGDAAGKLDPAVEETDRLAGLVSELLSLARADEPHEPVEVELGTLVSDRVDTWSAVAGGAGVELVLVDAGEDGRRKGSTRVWAAPGAVEQILDNLLDNAIEASPSGASVDVRVALDGERVRVEVVDHGPGLGDEEKDLAVHRFWRGDQRRPGTGLGLAIVDALATASGGTFALRDTPGGGLTASVELRPAP